MEIIVYGSVFYPFSLAIFTSHIISTVAGDRDLVKPCDIIQHD